MRLLSIELNDFQVHEKTTIELSPSITTIKGPTDAGKSAVLRALRWVCLNDLAGDEFIREGEKKTRIVLCVYHDQTIWEIARVKSSIGTRVNTYALNDAVCHAFGKSGVPSGIAALLQVSELNFQSQHDSPFWFAESAGEVSRRLNSIVDLSVIDTTLSNVASAVRQAQERKTVCNERLDEAKQELEKVKDVELRVEEFKRLKNVHEKASRAEADHYQLERLIKDSQSRWAEYRQLRNKEAEGDTVLGFGSDSLKVSRKVSRLRELISGVVYLRDRAIAPPSFGPVTLSFSQWQSAKERAETLSSLVGQIKRGARLLESCVETARMAEKTYHQQTKGKRCPLCGNVM